MTNNDFINYISLFKGIKNKIEKFCNKIYSEFIEINTKKNNEIKIKFENIKNAFLNELQNNIQEINKINNNKENNIKNNNKIENIIKNEVKNASKKLEINNKNKNIKKIDDPLKLKILQEIKENLSNNNKLEFHPPEIELNHL